MRVRAGAGAKAFLLGIACLVPAAPALAQQDSRAEGASAHLGTILDRGRILSVAQPGRTLGEVLPRLVPALEARREEWGAAGALCLEFRAFAASDLSGDPARETCRHPSVYLDGTLLADPATAYAITALEQLDWIQAVSPAEGSGRFGGSPFGVINIATARVGTGGSSVPVSGREYLRERRGGTFDWSTDPHGHRFLRTLGGAAVGNAVGLASGIALGRRCLYVEEGTGELDTECGRMQLVGSGLVAVALPALGSALGARIAGSTPASRGRLAHALVGAGMALVPGYLFSLTTVGGGLPATNGVGYALLVVGTPTFTALADRLYRSLTGP